MVRLSYTMYVYNFLWNGPINYVKNKRQKIDFFSQLGVKTNLKTDYAQSNLQVSKEQV